jgi:hypothetical protein
MLNKREINRTCLSRKCVALIEVPYHLLHQDQRKSSETNGERSLVRCLAI